MMEQVTTDLRDRLLIRLLFHLGCRVSGALALSVDDIDFDQSVVTIRHPKRRLNIFCSECEARLGVSQPSQCIGRREL